MLKTCRRWGKTPIHSLTCKLDYNCVSQTKEINKYHSHMMALHYNRNSNHNYNYNISFPINSRYIRIHIQQHHTWPDPLRHFRTCIRCTNSRKDLSCCHNPIILFPITRHIKQPCFNIMPWDWQCNLHQTTIFITRSTSHANIRNWSTNNRRRAVI